MTRGARAAKDIQPVHVAAYIEELQEKYSALGIEDLPLGKRRAALEEWLETALPENYLV